MAKREKKVRPYLCPKCFWQKPDKGVCGGCRFDEGSYHHDPRALPLRHRLDGRYTLGISISSGPRSIIYLAKELKTEKKIVIKEYFPRDLARRLSREIRPQDGSETEFLQGLRSFLAEADILDRLNHPNVVKFHGRVELNRTAYILMEYCEEGSLFSILQENYRTNQMPLDESHALKVMDPILETLDYVHQEGIIHCDVNPLNIHIIQPEQVSGHSRPVLLDFGSARLIGSGLGDRRTTRTSGFSPPEQELGEVSDFGCWTDVYACAATLYQLTTGMPPPPALSRQRRDTLQPPEKLVPSLSPKFSQGLIEALALDFRQRPQSIRDFRFSLGLNHNSPVRVGPTQLVGPKTRWIDVAARSVRTLLAPCFVLAMFLVCVFFVAWPVHDERPVPVATEDSYIVQSADFYVLRDVSLSPSIALYQSLEDALLQSIRTSDPQSADRTSYAVFARDVYNGKNRLQPATEGEDIVERMRSRVGENPPPLEFRQTTRFDVLFNALRETIGGGYEGRKIFVLIISDGVHDITGRETGCLEVSGNSSPLGSVRVPLEALIRDTKAEVLLILTGGRKECGRFVIRQWEGLRLSLPEGLRPKFRTLPLADISDSTQMSKARFRLLSYWAAYRRAPCVTLRPVNYSLTDEQRAQFDKGEEFSADFLVQPHLVGVGDEEAMNFISKANILDYNGKLLEKVDVVSRPGAEEKVILDPVASLSKNGGDRACSLFFKFRKEHALSIYERYRIVPKLEKEQLCESAGDRHAVEGISAELGSLARVQKVRNRRLLTLAMVTSAFAVLFIGCAYYYRRNYDRRRKNHLLFRSLFEEVFWYWIAFFVVTPLVLAVLTWRLQGDYRSTLIWEVWFVVVLGLMLCVADFKSLTKNLAKPAAPSEEMIFILQSVFLPLASFLLSLPFTD